MKKNKYKRSKQLLNKIIICLCLIFLFLNFTIVQASEIDLKGYINELKSYGNELIPEIYEEGFIEELISGNIKIDGENLLQRIINVFIKEIKNSMKLIFKILSICIFCSIIKNLQSANENRSKRSCILCMLSNNYYTNNNIIHICS